jgi:nucleoside-diphosphate-sugar epimerase
MEAFIMMRVAIAGGTGLVGRYAKEALCRAGHETVTLARATAGGAVLSAAAGCG